MIRIPKTTGGSSIRSRPMARPNPYLLAGRRAAAGLDGRANKRDPGKAARYQHVLDGDKSQEAKKACRSSARRHFATLEKSYVVKRQALGRAGGTAS